MSPGGAAINRKVTGISFTLLLAAFLACCQTSRDKNDFNIIFISLDTTRYDYIDTGKGARAVTPAIRRFSKEAIIFENAFAPSAETLPSHLSAFTSYYPYELGVRRNADDYDSRFPLLQEVLKKKDYYTYGVISLWTLEELGAGKRFDEFDLQLLRSERNHYVVKADKVAQKAIQELEILKNKKFFMFVHFSDPHAPYSPPGLSCNFYFYLNNRLVCRFSPYTGIVLRNIQLEKGTNRLVFKLDESAADFKRYIIKDLPQQAQLIEKSGNIGFKEYKFGGSYVLNEKDGWVQVRCENSKKIKLQFIPVLKSEPAKLLYKKEVEFMDAHVGKFLDAVKRHRLMNKTIIVIFSDHGEGLGERDGFFGHIEYLNRQFIRVPMIWHIPGEKHRRIASPVSLTGLSSTILQYLYPEENRGKHSFVNNIKNVKSEHEKIYSFVLAPPSKINKMSIIQWPYQGIYYWDTGGRFKEFYHLGKKDCFSHVDQIPKKDLDFRGKKLYYRFFQDFLDLRRQIQSASFSESRPNRKKIERLRGLGYLNDSRKKRAKKVKSLER